jgi:hypothetical protein
VLDASEFGVGVFILICYGVGPSFMACWYGVWRWAEFLFSTHPLTDARPNCCNTVLVQVRIQRCFGRVASTVRRNFCGDAPSDDVHPLTDDCFCVGRIKVYSPRTRCRPLELLERTLNTLFNTLFK